MTNSRRTSVRRCAPEAAVARRSGAPPMTLPASCAIRPAPMPLPWPMRRVESPIGLSEESDRSRVMSPIGLVGRPAAGEIERGGGREGILLRPGIACQSSLGRTAPGRDIGGEGALKVPDDRVLRAYQPAGILRSCFAGTLA